MNLPQIPTDNLYKFMALFGLIIAFVSFYLPLKQIRDLHLEVIDLTGQIEVATKKTNFVTSRISLAMKQKPSAASAKRAEELASVVLQ